MPMALTSVVYKPRIVGQRTVKLQYVSLIAQEGLLGSLPVVYHSSDGCDNNDSYISDVPENPWRHESLSLENILFV
jgi:hypothetical protein